MTAEERYREMLLRSLREVERLREAEARHQEPVAVVGVGLRLPGGVVDLAGLFRLVTGDADAVGEPPPNRWSDTDWYDPRPDTPDRSYVRRAGYVAGVEEFDADFFGISPREARQLDPQHRLLLEVSWQALEDARIVPGSLLDTRTGVFTGIGPSDYEVRKARGTYRADSLSATSGSASFAAGRLAYTLGVRGPALSVDTACSSSLVATHLAVQALRRGECDLALAAGVQVIATPTGFVVLAQTRALAPDGRSKTFAADADGFGRGEGCVVVVLQRLSDALAAGAPIHAVIRGSAVNHDGRSSGMTAPNGTAQQEVIRAALADAGLGPTDIDVVECHGTGTVLGDPIEVNALTEVYCRDREQPVLLTALKSHVGHLEAASGLAGLAKTVAALKHGTVPPTLHSTPRNPHIDWNQPISVPETPQPWPDTDRPHRAAISAFGLSGTNAHVILEQAPAPADRTPAEAPRNPLLWTVSGASPAALRAQARRLCELDADPTDLAYALATTRTHFPHRAAVTGRTLADLRAGLMALADDRDAANLVTGQARTARTVFVFPGQGSQWTGMGRELLDTSPAFAEAMTECATALAPHIDWSLLDVIRGETPMDTVDVVQPALFAMMVSLAKLWQHHGVQPDAVIGHSQGEIAAAHITGALSLSDAATIVALRAKALRHITGQGGMASVIATPDQIRELADDRISIAAINGPRTTIVSGPPDTLDNLINQCQTNGIRAQHIPVDYASHSPHVDDLREQILNATADIRPRKAEIPFYSTVTATRLDTTELKPEYWYRNLREPVELDATVRQLLDHGHTALVEISPHPVLAAALAQIVDDADHPASVLRTLRRDDGGAARFHTALAEAHTRGVTVDWTAVFAGTGAKAVPLPTYAFQRVRHWLTEDDSPAETDPAEQRFWHSVDREDPDALTDLLDLDDPDAMRALLPAITAWRRRRRDESTVDNWCYRTAWVPCTDRITSGTATRSLLIVVSDSQDMSRLPVPGTVLPVSRDADRRRLAERLRAALADLPGPCAVLSLLTDPADTLALAQAVADTTGDLRLWLATRHAVSVGPTDPPPRPDHARHWGLGQVFALEHPTRWGGLVDLEDTLDERARTRLYLALAHDQPEDQIALRREGFFARRLVRTTLPDGGWTPRGTVLVTGGTGALGAHVARWLAEAGADHVVLTSRRGVAAPGAQELTAELTALGARVTVAACDVADRAALARLLTDLDEPITAVFHTAGTLDRTPLTQLTPAVLADVAAAKAGGAALLDELLDEHPIEAFVLFSSAAATWGSGHQGGYVAANAYLDALAQRRHALGKPGLSVAWGAWAGGGMADTPALDRLTERGLRAMAPHLAVSALRRALAGGAAALTVADVDWARFAPVYASARPRPLLNDLPEARAALEESTSETPADGELVARLRPLSERDRLTHLVSVVLAETAAVMEHPDPGALSARTGFLDMGLDSLTSVELRRRLERATGLRLPATLAFDHPSPHRVAVRLRECLADALGAVEPSTMDHSGPSPAHEPVAVVGIGLRLPGGVVDLAGLWQLVTGDTDAVGDPPPGRWSEEADWRAAFLTGVEEFDADFFGISPREARQLDPQHRLLLEVSWQALEDARIVPGSLLDTRTGVFTGIGPSDYELRKTTSGQRPDAFSATTGQSSFAAGRLAFTLGLRGPALSVDTACSSSLVATHLAVQALRRGECDLALAAGVQVIATPTGFTVMSETGALATDGRSKTFAADADGFGRGEGCVVVVLQRLSDAVAADRRIHGVVRGVAVNHDGRSSGMTAPNGTAQQEVIRAALADAGLGPADVDLVECHGTGTVLGDPIEVNALAAVYAERRAVNDPLHLSALKPHLGHLEAASGLAGVAKTLAALNHRTVPPTLHSTPRNPHIDWALPISVPETPRPWPETDRPRRAAVSAFGLSGTNAHLILEQPPKPDPVEPATPPPHALLWTLSAISPEALRAQAGQLMSYLDTEPDLTDLASTLATTRTHFPQRAAIIGRTREHLRTGLAALADDRRARDLITDRADAGPIAFVFPGQGSQWNGMPAMLAETFPAFLDELDDVCAHFDQHLDRPLRDVLFAAPDDVEAAALHDTTYTQPALFAVQVALFRLLRSLGITPHQLLGHSIGELSAAHCAGVLTLDDACALVAARAAFMGRLAPGAMISIEATEAEIRPWLTDTVSIAAVNGPRTTVVSGVEDAVTALAARFGSLGRRTRRLAVRHAFHSPLVEPMLAEFHDVAARLRYAEPVIPVVSTLTGEAADLNHAEYWVRQVREPVRFADGLRRLGDQGTTTFIEVGPQGPLAGAADACLPPRTRVLATLGAEKSDPDLFVQTLARLHAAGHDLDWPAFFAGAGARRIDLPGYAFQRRRYWIDTAAAVASPSAHPILTSTVDIAGSRATVLGGRLSARAQSWLADHVVQGTAVLPATAFVDLALTAGDRLGLPGLAELTVEAPLPVLRDETLELQLVVEAPDGTGARRFGVHSRPTPEAEWTRHAGGILTAPSRPSTLDTTPPSGALPVDLDELYARLSASGFRYGPAFQGLHRAWRHGDDLFAEVHLPETEHDRAGAFAVHPALLDAALHTLPAGGDGTAAALPFSFTLVRLHQPGARALRVRLRPAGPDAVSITATDTTGAPVVSVDAMLLRALPAPRRSLHQVTWAPVAAPALDPPRHAFADGDLTAIADPVPPVVLLSCTRCPDDDLLVATHAETARVLDVAQRWLAEPRFASSRLVVLTRDAVATAKDDDVTDLVHAPLWGLLRSALSEQPDRFGIIDLDGDPGTDTAALLAALAVDEPQLAVRNGQILAPGLEHAAAEGTPPSWRPDGTVLITGGTGTLAGHVATHLVTDHGVRHLLLVSRRGPDAAGAAELRSGLAALGATVTIVAADTAEEDALRRVLADIPAEHPLSAVVHTAGVVDDATLGTLDTDRLRAVLRAKVDSVVHLHRLTADLPLTHFVLFSSAAATLGAPGQANYAAANAFLDALAHHRRAAGLPATAQAWGLWRDTSGITATLSTTDQNRISRRLRPMDTAEALALFDATFATDQPHLVPAHLHTPTPPRRDPTHLVVSPDEPATALRIVRTEVAAALGFDSPADVDPDRPLLELGLDSLMTIEVRNRIADATGVRLPATALFDAATAADVARRLTDRSDTEPSDDTELEEDTGPTGDTVGQTYLRACRDDRFAAGERLLAAAAALRPTTTMPPVTAPVRLADGGAVPELICFPAIAGPTGPNQFARLAAGLRGRRPVFALPNPGFHGGDPLPADLDALVAAQARAVAEHAAGRPFALLGYSSGGMVAHATATHLEQLGISPSAVVLLDTYAPKKPPHPRLLAALRRLWLAGFAAVPEPDEQLTAMAWYLDLFREWRPEPLRCPLFFLRPTDVLPDDEPSDTYPWRSTWDAEHVAVDLPGDHVTLLAAHATTTAQSVDEVLSRIRSARKGDAT
ncbi:type I polyketide synthase [Actinoallomurus iriomotensis]|uniref:Uncharacterized protein n=1 Tax=Actinoallomurus iriomotensis TaxID=478107 RepID=A0A9W6SFM8_9ACTN|nr:type I polyketide synthase [Actinoallomurus iriomotensis]GLY91997.1 hypothetical protein Airi02_099250 [Actinoallomurus iriomotensis]